MLLKLLSPISVLAGLVTAVIAIAVLWPVDEYGTPVALMAFALGAGIWELVRRIRAPAAAAPAVRKPKTGE